MAKKNTSQLTEITSGEQSYDDLFVVAADNTSNNLLLTSQLIEFIKNYSDVFPVNMYQKYIQFNDTESPVSLISKLLSEIESITFDAYGNITDLTDRSVSQIQRQLDIYSGTLSLKNVDNLPGWFSRYTPLKSSTYNYYNSPSVSYTSTISNTIQTGNWSLLFGSVFDFRKSIITYSHAKLDNFSTDQNFSYYKVYIYWGNTADTTQIEATGLIKGQGDNGFTGPTTYIPFYYPFGVIQDNVDMHAHSMTFGTSAQKSAFNKMVLNIDGVNKKINKLPLTPYGSNFDSETHAINVTIESFA
jgi:hypothetical protein